MHDCPHHHADDVYTHYFVSCSCCRTSIVEIVCIKCHPPARVLCDRCTDRMGDPGSEPAA